MWSVVSPHGWSQVRTADYCLRLVWQALCIVYCRQTGNVIKGQVMEEVSMDTEMA